MTRRLLRTAALAAALAGLAAGPASAAPGEITPVGDPIAGSYIVTLKSSVTGIDATARRLAADAGAQVGFVYTSALRGFSIKGSRSEALALSRSPLVASVAEDARYHAVGTQTGGPYGLDRIDQRNLPLNNTYTYANAAPACTPTIIDTGIRTTHSQFEGRASIGYRRRRRRPARRRLQRPRHARRRHDRRHGLRRRQGRHDRRRPRPRLRRLRHELAASSPASTG